MSYDYGIEKKFEWTPANIIMTDGWYKLPVIMIILIVMQII